MCIKHKWTKWVKLVWAPNTGPATIIKCSINPMYYWKHRACVKCRFIQMKKIRGK